VEIPHQTIFAPEESILAATSFSSSALSSRCGGLQAPAISIAGERRRRPVFSSRSAASSWPP